MSTRFEGIAIEPKPSSGGSWWVTENTREAFTAAYAREKARLEASKDRADGENRVVGSKHGRV